MLYNEGHIISFPLNLMIKDFESTDLLNSE